MKLTAELTTTEQGTFYALHADGKMVSKQRAVKLEQELGEWDSFTVTFEGRVGKDGVMQICEV